MDQDLAVELVNTLYRLVLRRLPAPGEAQRWAEHIVFHGVSTEEFLEILGRSEEFLLRTKVEPFFPIGHYYSAIVDPSVIGDYLDRTRPSQHTEIAGIRIETERMLTMWRANLSFLQATPFTDKPNAQHRYWYENDGYPFGDASILRMMIRHFRPKRIVEIGSGQSSACMLDSADEIGLPDLQLTCIDPFPQRLKKLLRTKDNAAVRVIEKPVQNVPMHIFTELEAGDILFIDSTHVMKTGSDVHHEIFHILPTVKQGVIVHFHDVPYPFEYPAIWIFEKNYSWNEAYAVRAFLMYNSHFEIRFWNSLFAQSYFAEIEREFPLFLNNPGSGLWVEKVLPDKQN